MAAEKLARRYAAAVFSLADEAGAIDRVGGELRAAADAIEGDPALRDFFRSPVVDREAKSAALHAVFGGRVETIVAHTLLLLVRKRRESLLGELAAAYERLAQARRGREALRVTSARPLAEAELASLVDRLGAAYGKRFDVSPEVDPRLIGGVRVQLDDRRLDGSVAGRLEELAAHLFSQS